METYSTNNIKKKLETLSIWKNNISVKVLEGGWSNHTYLVTDDNKKYVAKIGGDKKDFGVIRFNEIQAYKAGHQVGISPNVIYHKKEISIYEYIQSKVLTLDFIKDEKNLKKIIYLINIIHNKVSNYLEAPHLFINIFQMLDYKFDALKKNNSPYIDKLNDLVKDYKLFQSKVKSHKVVFTHNDFYFKNILHDGKNFLIIDWEYSGFNANILDLGNLSRNIELNIDEDNFILEEYFRSPVTLKLMSEFQAIKCISILNELLWWMLSEIKSTKSIDYKSITKEKIERYKIAKQKFIE